MRVRGICGALWAVAALAACGKSIERQPDGPPPEGIDFSYRRAILACEVAYDCGHLNENSTQRCKAEAKVSDPDYIRSLEAALRGGTVEYDPQSAAECFKTMRDTCLTNNIGACGNAFVGKLPLGEACTLSAECEGDARCIGQDESGTNPSCMPDIEGGDACGGLGLCPAAPGEVGLCEDFDGMSRCYVATTVDRAGAGERCGMTPPNDDRETHLTLCDPYLRCDDGVCSPLLGPGDPCEHPTDCGPDAMCIWEDCVPIVVRENAGESCGFDATPNPTVFEDCDVDDLACKDDVCQLKGDGSEGSVCDAWQFHACDEGLDCESSSSLCVPRQ